MGRRERDGHGVRARRRAGAVGAAAAQASAGRLDAERDQAPSAVVRAGATPAGAGAVHDAGGYRLVRVLGDGQNGVVHLGFAEGAGPEEPPRTAAVKIHRDRVPREHVDTEIAALTRASHPHALRLHDVATLADGRACLIVERVGGRSLGRLVAESDIIGAGEAVTILAPIADAVNALHTVGVAHGRIRLSNVLFRDSGAPVLVGFGRASLLVPGASAAALSAHPAVLDDRRQLVTLVGAVLDRVDGEAANELARQIGAADVSADGFTAWLSERLFDLAPPQPVRFVRGDGRPRAPRIVHDSPPRAEPVRGPGRAAVRRLDHAVRAVIGRARGVRPRLWFVAGGVLVSLVAAALVIPTGDAPPTGGGGSDGGVSGESVAGDGVSGDSVREDGVLDGGESATPAPVPSPPAGSTGGGAGGADGTAEADVLAGDDPVAALVVLLRDRERCIRDVSVLCLDGVLQPGSAAMQRDAGLVRSVQAGGELADDAVILAEAPVLLERLGDSALVGLGAVPQTQPASVLVMRSEAGWRIRNYL